MKNIHRVLLCSGLAALLMMTAGAGGHKKDCTSSFSNGSSLGRLSEIVCQAENMPFLKSLIVIQDGKVVIEKDMHGGAADQSIDLRSASKSILSAVLGIAIRDGHIKGIDQKVMDFSPEYPLDELDPRVPDFAIAHLATMTSGLAVTENAATYQDLYESTDWNGHILHLPMDSNPGEKFNYLSFNTHLLSAIITRATGIDLLMEMVKPWVTLILAGYHKDQTKRPYTICCIRPLAGSEIVDAIVQEPVCPSLCRSPV